MKTLSILLTLVALCSLPVNAQNSKVTRAKELYAQQKVYIQGCSSFVSEVLGISWENANSLMGNDPVWVGTNNRYSGLTPGDVVGWKSASGSGHVAIFIGEGDVQFIDVPGPGKKPRKIKGYGSYHLYKSLRY